ncbi:MAG: hypothetical protein KJ052_12005 [Candidatus Hydrogenedentes bacterium]|nr:hypothetical protein [Candidatus Hydrogenedentota bacterium]
MTLRFFHDEKRFFRHCRDHFFNDDEPWDQIIPREVLQRMRKKFESATHLPWTPEWQDFYEAICKALEHGIQEALARPVFALCEQTVEPSKGSAYQRESVFFLSDKGFLVKGTLRTVKTAHFVTPGGTRCYYYLYRRAWQQARSRLAALEYVDSKLERTVKNIRVEYNSEENWRLCPNPHKKPAGSPPRARRAAP